MKQKTEKLLFLAYFRYFEKNKVGLRDHYDPCVSKTPFFNFRMHEPIFRKLGVFAMTPEPISTA
jgi:hypothetical protein